MVVLLEHKSLIQKLSSARKDSLLLDGGDEVREKKKEVDVYFFV